MSEATREGIRDHRMTFDIEWCLRDLRRRHEERSPGRPFDAAAALRLAEAAAKEMARRDFERGHRAYVP